MEHLSYKSIIDKYKNDNQFPVNYLKDLLDYYFDTINNEIDTDNLLSAIYCFIPLPSGFIINDRYSGGNKVIKSGKKYRFMGTPGNRILFGDKLLPYDDKNTKFPLPFTFPICEKNKIKLLQSNVYYYEVTIEPNKNTNKVWDTQCVSIGFGNSNVPFSSHVGWYYNSIGYHSDDGCVYYNISDQGKKISKPWTIGSTAGAGLIYIDINKVIPFFTLNGKLVKIFKSPVILTEPLFPMVGYDHPNTLKLNFSTEPFKFNITKIIREHSQNIISTQNSFLVKDNEDPDISNYYNDIFIKKKNTYNQTMKKLHENIIKSGDQSLLNLIQDLTNVGYSLQLGNIVIPFNNDINT